MQFLLPTKKLSDKQFLESFIKNLAKYNILVLENTESHNKKYKSNLYGFFIKPNIIALKNLGRKREIFTLAHELGHYLLNNENIDKDIFIQNPQDEEAWCSQFAFYLLIGEQLNTLESLQKDEITSDNKTIQTISNQKHISRLALFYHCVGSKKISWTDYNSLKDELEKEYVDKKQAQRDKQGKNSGFPRNHAGGNQPDIICIDKDSQSIVEVSLICGRAQVNNELLPITRHLSEMIEQSKDNTHFAIFVAPKIFEDSRRYADFIKFSENLDIRNLSIIDFIANLKNCQTISQVNGNV